MVIHYSSELCRITSGESKKGLPSVSTLFEFPMSYPHFHDGNRDRQQVTTWVDLTVQGESGADFASLAKKG